MICREVSKNIQDINQFEKKHVNTARCMLFVSEVCRVLCLNVIIGCALYALFVVFIPIIGEAALHSLIYANYLSMMTRTYSIIVVCCCIIAIILAVIYLIGYKQVERIYRKYNEKELNSVYKYANENYSVFSCEKSEEELKNHEKVNRVYGVYRGVWVLSKYDIVLKNVVANWYLKDKTIDSDLYKEFVIEKVLKIISKASIALQISLGIAYLIVFLINII